MIASDPHFAWNPEIISLLEALKSNVRVLGVGAPSGGGKTVFLREIDKRSSSDPSLLVINCELRTEESATFNFTRLEQALEALRPQLFNADSQWPVLLNQLRRASTSSQSWNGIQLSWFPVIERVLQNDMPAGFGITSVEAAQYVRETLDIIESKISDNRIIVLLLDFDGAVPGEFLSAISILSSHSAKIKWVIANQEETAEEPHSQLYDWYISIPSLSHNSVNALVAREVPNGPEGIGGI